jgi:hypothetical protein
MSAIAHEAPKLAPAKRGRLAQLRVHEIWAALAITVVWLAVLFDAVFGPDIVSTTTTSSTTVPSAVVVALFAWLATRPIAKYGFGNHANDEDPTATNVG